MEEAEQEVAQEVERVVRWDGTLLERLHPADPAARWLSTLIDAGVIIELEDVPRWDPARRLRRGVAALHHAEEALVAANLPVPITVGDVPPAVWAAMFAVGFLALAFTTLIETLAICALVFGAFGLVGLGWYLRERRAHGTRQRAAIEGRAAAAAEAYAALQSLFTEDFVAITGRTRVECTRGVPRM